MANRTVKDAHTIHGTNPQYLVEKIIRTRIYESRYWKEDCFALTAELLVDKAVELSYIGGVYSGSIKPSPFLCLLQKMLQIQPDKDIIIEFIKQMDYKYVRALGAIYLRLVGESLECYKYLEPLYNDYRKLKRLDRTGTFSLIHMDEFIYELLHSDRVSDVILPRIQKRHFLEESQELEPRQSVLNEELEDIDLDQLGHLEEEVEKTLQAQSKANKFHKSRRRRDSGGDLDAPRRRRNSSRDRRHRSRSPHGRRRRSRSRSSSHSRDKRRREHRERRRDNHSESPDDKRSRRRKKRRTDDHDKDEDIRVQNELRAKLGLKPLR